MYTEIIKIIEGGLDKDKDKIINYSNLLAKKLQDEGELKFSEKIKKLIQKKSIHPVYLDELMATPVDQESRMNMVDVLYPPENPDEKLVFPEFIKMKIDDFILSLSYKDKILAAGIDPLTSLLLYGPPGCGKTSIAHYISQKSQLPLVTVRLDSLVSSLLGSTSKNIRKIFDFSKKKPCILFLDEFDAIAKARDDQHELGELKRVVNSLLQNIDEFNKDNILIAATNHHELLDPAIWRRFSTIIEISKPDQENIAKLVKLYLNNIENDFIDDSKKVDIISKLLIDISPAEIKTVCHIIIKKYIIRDEKYISFNNFIFEICLFKNDGVISQKDLAKFLSENGVPRAIIKGMLNISMRQVNNHLNE